MSAAADAKRSDGSYEIHYHPPSYPTTFFPGRCDHPGTMTVCHNVEINRARRGPKIEMDHIVCLGCGVSRGGTYGGNILVDVSMCLQSVGPKHWRFQVRLQQIRNRWARLATYLFDENGWNGRHERIARMIDPNLTMRLFIEGRVGQSDIRIGRITFDESYLRPKAEKSEPKAPSQRKRKTDDARRAA